MPLSIRPAVPLSPGVRVEGVQLLLGPRATGPPCDSRRCDSRCAADCGCASGDLPENQRGGARGPSPQTAVPSGHMIPTVRGRIWRNQRPTNPLSPGPSAGRQIRITSRYQRLACNMGQVPLALADGLRRCAEASTCWERSSRCGPGGSGTVVPRGVQKLQMILAGFAPVPGSSDWRKPCRRKR